MPYQKTVNKADIKNKSQNFQRPAPIKNVKHGVLKNTQPKRKHYLGITANTQIYTTKNIPPTPIHLKLTPSAQASVQCNLLKWYLYYTVISIAIRNG